MRPLLGLALLLFAIPQSAVALSGSPPPRDIGVPAGTYTLPELATRLSAPGRRVRCAASLRNRAAFVSLRPRPLASVAAILSASLGVRLEQERTGDWSLTPDPAIEARDARWRLRYVARFRRMLEEHVTAWRREYEARPRAILVRELASLREENRRVAALIEAGAVGIDDPAHARSWTAAVDMDNLLSPATAAVFRTVAGEWTAQTLLQRGWLLGAVPVSSGRLPGLTPSEVRERWPEAGAAHDVALYGVSYSPVDGVCSGWTCLVSPKSAHPCFAFAPEAAYERRLPRIGHRADELAAELGADRTAWLAAERASTRAFLASAVARAEISQQDPVWAELSELVERWSRALGRDAVMELSPARECGFWSSPAGMLAYPRTAAKVSLAVVFGGLGSPEERIRDARLSDRDAGIVRRDGGDYVHELPEWSLRELDGVLLVLNRYAFLDRERAYPLAAFLALERRIQEPRNQGGRPPLPYSALAAYARSVSPEENATWCAPEHRYAGTYRASGAPMGELTLAQPFLLLLESLPLRERSLLWKRLARSEQGVVRIPLAAFPLPALVRLVAGLRTLGFEYPSSWHPGFLEELSRRELDVSIAPEIELLPDARDWFDVRVVPDLWDLTLTIPGERDRPVAGPATLYRVRLPR